jgi:hypothetical protein
MHSLFVAAAFMMMVLSPCFVALRSGKEVTEPAR